MRLPLTTALVWGCLWRGGVGWAGWGGWIGFLVGVGPRSRATGSSSAVVAPSRFVSFRSGLLLVFVDVDVDVDVEASEPSNGLQAASSLVSYLCEYHGAIPGEDAAEGEDGEWRMQCRMQPSNENWRTKLQRKWR